MDVNASDSVEAAMTALAEGRIEAFRAVDAEMGLSVTIVDKEADRYCVRRTTVGVPEGEASTRDEWRSGRWISTMLEQGHWAIERK